MDRAALRMTVRRVAHAQGAVATRAALLHLEDTARTLDAVLRRVTAA